MSSISHSSPYETNYLQFSPKTLPSSSPASTLNFTKSSKNSLRNSISQSATLESAIITSDHLTKSDLVDYFLTGCKPKPKWRIGTEHEKFGFDRKTLRPITYFQISQLLNTIAERFNYEKILEDGVNVVGLKKNNLSITLEPGGQLELSGAPVRNIHETRSEIETHLHEVKSVASEMGIAFCGIGFNPKWALDQIPVMPKSRYDIMTSYLPKIGSTGVDTMFRTCTVQVNLDYSSEADMVKKLRVSLALQPIATAIFANSPFSEGKANGFVSKRSDLWIDVGGNRVGMLPFVFEEGFGFERYVEYLLDVPMLFVKREGKFVDCSGLSFRDFMRGELSVLPGEYPTVEDWEVHLTTVFPEVRTKKYLEMRGADVGPVSTLCALPAFWVGLLYDEASLESAWKLVEGWTKEEREELRKNVPVMGLRTGFRGGRVKEVAEEVVTMAREGLERRGLGEEVYLDGAREVVESGVTAAERLVEKFNGEWGRSVDPVYEELMY